MSIAIEVYLHADRLPTVKDWQQQITQEGFDLNLDDDGSPLQELSGCLPAIYNGVNTGFEFYLDKIEEEPDPLLLLAVGDRESVTTFRFAGDPNAMDAAVAASSVLAQMCDGILYDTEAGTFVSGADAVASSREETRQAEYWRAVDATPEAKQRKAEREKQLQKRWWQIWR